MRLISIAGIGFSVIFAVCHVVEHYVFLDPAIMPGYNFFKSPIPMLKVQSNTNLKVPRTCLMKTRPISRLNYTRDRL